VDFIFRKSIIFFLLRRLIVVSKSNIDKILGISSLLISILLQVINYLNVNLIKSSIYKNIFINLTYSFYRTYMILFSSKYKQIRRKVRWGYIVFFVTIRLIQILREGIQNSIKLDKMIERTSKDKLN
jgi:hypothetical protein